MRIETKILFALSLVCVWPASAQENAPDLLIVGARSERRQAASRAGTVVLSNRFGRAEISLCGAQVISYVPAGGSEVFFMPKDRDFTKCRFLHGGVPVCWPFFNLLGDPLSSQHGFALFADWTLADRYEDADLSRVVLTLDSSAETKRLWPFDFRLTYTVTLTDRLAMDLKTVNAADPVKAAGKWFELTQGLHAYFRVSDPNDVTLAGVVDENRMPQTIRCSRPMSGVSPIGSGEYLLSDPTLKRSIAIGMRGAKDMILWNPGTEPLKPRSNRTVGDEKNFVCIEPAVLRHRGPIRLNPGESCQLQLTVREKKGATAAGRSVVDFCRRAEAGERLTVAFFGGSLTWGANATDPNRKSWRALIGQKLEARYPKAHFKFVDAAIGGTGSNLGIFRLKRDVLAYRPDLVFVEWAVNDGAYGAEDCFSSSYEGILRGLLAERPDCVPVQVILPDRKTVTLTDESKLKRRAEHHAIGTAYNLVRADVLGEFRRRYAAGQLDLDAVWPPAIGDNTHPFDGGYALYADIIWNAVFGVPAARPACAPEKELFAPKYRHVVRADLADRTDLPKGWRRGHCAMRAGTFDFLCSRWLDGLAVATNGAAPLKTKFRGEVLLLFGESHPKSPVCEVFVDGKRIAQGATSDFGTWFAPSAYLNWAITTALDPKVEHTLEIRPVFKAGEAQEFRLSAICVAGRDAAEVGRID